MTGSFSDQLLQLALYKRAIDQAALEFSDNPNPDVSIIIPIYNQAEYTIGCLSSIKRNTAGITYEVILIDDGSDLSVFHALSSIKGLRLIRNFKNLGFLRSCNRAANNARGKYLILLNNDTEVCSDWMTELLKIFRTRPDAGLVGAKLIYPDGTLQEAGGILWSDGSAWNYGRNDDPSKPEYNYVRETDYCSGACIMIPKPLFTSLDGFDTRYTPAYCEDSDLALAVRASGRKVYYQPGAQIIHHEGKSSGTDLNSGVKQYQVINNSKLIEKWAVTLKQDHAPNAQNVFKARERGWNKRTILFIDHYVPHFDQDAGSRTIYAYIKFFVDSGFSVKFIGDNFFPHQPYQSILQQQGVEVLTGPWYAENWEAWLSENGDNIDYVLLSRPHISEKYITPLRRHTRARLLFYGHDLFSRTLSKEADALGNDAQLGEAKRWEQIEGRVFSAVDVVYYPSPIETSYLKAKFPGINARTLTPYVFQLPATRYDRSPEQTFGLLFVGGFAHPPNVSAVTWFCAAVMPILRVQLPGITLTLAGSNPPPLVRDLASADVTITGYISDDELNALYSKNRLAIVPLLAGGGIKGKVVEALWKGIPIITTQIGAEGIDKAETAMIICEPSRFAGEIVAVYNDTQKLRALASAGHAVIGRSFSTDALAAAFEPELYHNRKNNL